MDDYESEKDRLRSINDMAKYNGLEDAHSAAMIFRLADHHVEMAGLYAFEVTIGSETQFFEFLCPPLPHPFSNEPDSVKPAIRVTVDGTSTLYDNFFTLFRAYRTRKTQ